VSNLRVSPISFPSIVADPFLSFSQKFEPLWSAVKSARQEQKKENEKVIKLGAFVIRGTL